MTVTVDVSSWAKRNCWRLPSGELAVRPGMRKLFDTSGSGKLIAPGGFTVRNDASGGEVWHYFVAYRDNATTNKQPQLFVVDENMATVQVFAINSNRAPRVVTYAITGDVGIICSPDFPTMHFLVGSGVHLARKVASLDGTVTALDVPQGICCSWVGSRVVIALGRLVYVSDPIVENKGDVRTFVAENIMILPGIVYGIHETGGMLVAVTDAGVYGCDSSAASVGEVGAAADWRMLNHHRVSNYGASCVVRGRVYALTQRGLMLVDVENDNEIILNEPMQSTGIGPGRYAMEDFRAARIVAGDHGPIVGVDDVGAAVFLDMSQSPPFVSWWKTSDFDAGSTFSTSSINGVLSDVDGNPLYTGTHGIYRATGDFDGGTTLTSTVTFPTGSLRGAVPSTPGQNLLPRFTSFGAAIGGGSAVLVRAALRGKVLTKAPSPDEKGLTIGTDSWGSTTKRYTVTPTTSVCFDTIDNRPTDDLTLEVGADSGLARLDLECDVDFSPSAQKRPSDKA